MKAESRTALALVGLCLALTGCVHSYLEVGNATEKTVTVTSGQTGESYRLAPGQTKLIPHSHGSVVISNSSGIVTIPDVTAAGGRKEKDSLFRSRLIKPYMISGAPDE